MAVKKVKFYKIFILDTRSPSGLVKFVVRSSNNFELGFVFWWPRTSDVVFEPHHTRLAPSAVQSIFNFMDSLEKGFIDSSVLVNGNIELDENLCPVQLNN